MTLYKNYLNFVSLLRNIPLLASLHVWLTIASISHLILGNGSKYGCNNNRPVEVSGHPSLARIEGVFEGLDKVVAEAEVEGEG